MTMTMTDQLEFAATAELLRRSRSTIINEWVKRVRALVPPANVEDRPSLTESLPETLEMLASELDGTSTEAQAEFSKEIAREHGKQRANFGSYSIEQVVLEYQVLREVLIEKLHPEIEAKTGAQHLIHRFVDQCIRRAAGQFARVEAHQQTVFTASIEAELRRLEDVFHQSPIPMMLFMHSDFRVTLINEPGLNIMRKTRSEVEGRTILEVASTNPKEGDRFHALLKQVFQTGIPYVAKELLFTWPTVAGEAEVSWIDLSYYPYRLNDEIVGVISYIQDATDKVLARKKIEESDQRFREIANAMPQIVWTATPDGSVDWYNKWWYEYTGNDRLKSPLEVERTTHPEDVEQTLAKWKDSLLRGVAYEIEYRFKRRSDEKYRWHLGRAVPVRGSDGNILRWVGTATDIEEQKTAENQSKLARQELSEFIMQAPSPMVILLGPEYTFAIANPAYERLVGRKVVGRTLAETFSKREVEYFIPQLDAVCRTGIPYIGKEVPMFLLGENGERREHFLNLGYYPFRSHEGKIRGISADVIDVTEQVLARRRIEESESKYRTTQEQLNLALESARMGAWTLNLTSGEVSYSDIMSEISGVPQTVITSIEIARRMVHPDDIDRVATAFRRAVENKSVYVDEYRIVRPNGSIRWIFSRGAITFNADGTPAVISGLFGDITERKRSEAALLDEQRKLETIFQVSPACMALWTGPDFVFAKLNSEYQRMFDDRQLLGLPLLEAVPELQGQAFPTILRNVLESGEPFVANEALVRLARRKHGPLEDRYFDFTYVRVHDSQGTAFGIYGHAVDVTDRVQGRKQLAASQDQLKIATESARIGTFIFEPKSMQFTLSNRSCEILGLQISESHGLHELATTIVNEEGDSFEDQINRLLDPEKSGTLMMDNKVLLPNGDTRYVFTTAQSVVETDSRGKRVSSIIGTHMDITERVRLKQDLEKAKIAADQANHSKSAFLANMSHEIRTPLGAILGFSALLKEAALAPEERDRYVETIARNGISLTHIIDDILDLAKVEAGRLDVETVNFSIYELMTDVVDLFRDKAKQKQIYVLLNVDENLPARLSSDPTRLRQILINLIGNAVKFTETGGVRVSVRAVNIAGDKATVEIAVKDSGIGLTDEQKQKLFQPFVQADNSTTRKFGGTGLGLVLSQRLSHALGGQISISDDCGGGAGCTFTLSFTAKVPTSFARAPRTKKSPAAPQLGSLKDVRVLVVDDSLDNQFLVTHLLTKNGAVVETASDGREALEKAIVGKHDVILMDIQMPTMDGYQAKKALDERGYPKPVIALTAHAMAEERLKTKSAGFAGHLTKPLAADELLQTVAHLAKHFH